MRKQKRIGQMLTLLLLIGYLGGTSSVEFIHIFMHEEHIVHSPEQENDPCHRLIYHHDVAQGCDHDMHLVASNSCDMCDLIYHHHDQSLSNAMVFQNIRFKTEFFSHHKVNLDSYWAVISSSRAPPALI